MKPISTDIEKAREQLAEILSQPEFGRGQMQKEAPGSYWEGEFPDWLRWLTEHSSEMYWSAYIFLGVFIAVILFWITRGWWIRRAGTKPVGQKKDDRLPLPVQAEAMAEQGKYRMAVRLLFHYLLELMSRQKKIFLQTGKTNGDYQREMKKTWPAKEKPFSLLTKRFDEVWYGRKQVGDMEFALYKKKVMQFLEKGERDEA